MILAACNGLPGQVVTRPAMAPPASQKIATALLYVSDAETSSVYVFELPNGNLVQTLTGFDRPSGECVDKTGNVFIVDSNQSVVREYAHGGKTPIKLLNDAGYAPTDCSIDPVTGNLAVTNYRTFGENRPRQRCGVRARQR